MEQWSAPTPTVARLFLNSLVLILASLWCMKMKMEQEKINNKQAQAFLEYSLLCKWLSQQQWISPPQAELDGQSVGACTAHAHRCGAGIGLFLRLVPPSTDLCLCYSSPCIAEFGSARLWCFRGGQKAALNLHPILIRWQMTQIVLYADVFFYTRFEAWGCG